MPQANPQMMPGLNPMMMGQPGQVPANMSADQQQLYRQQIIYMQQQAIQQYQQLL